MSDFHTGDTNRGRTRRRAQTQAEQLFLARNAGSAYDPEDTLEPLSPEEAYSDPAYQRGGFATNDIFISNEAPAMPLMPPVPVAPATPAAPAYNPYARPTGDVQPAQESQDAFAYAPPPKFEAPSYLYNINAAEEEPAVPTFAPQANVYQPKAATWAETARQASLSMSQRMYKVEEGQADAPRSKRRKKRALRRVIIVACVLVVLGGVAFLNRDWLMEQYQGGSQSVTAGVDPLDMSVETAAVKGYDPAPETKINEKATNNIAALCGTMDIETYAVTAANVAGRVQTAEDLYDYYLFSAADGQLLGYYEGLSSEDFLAQPGDCFYVRQPPYLVSSRGKPLIDPALYQGYVGKDAILGPMVNGWAVISDAAGTKYNYINAQGEILSTLWFARAFPFTGELTVAYVDTGNLTNPEERYILYVLSTGGEMAKWKNTADTQGVVGAACGMVYMDTGELIALSDYSQPLCYTDDVSIYLDCEALVVRERESGKCGLFVGGEQHYDFTYDSILPVECDIRWRQQGDSRFKLYAVTGARYPLPLSHYFRLMKGDEQEMVALSTGSVYPAAIEQ